MKAHVNSQEHIHSQQRRALGELDSVQVGAGMMSLVAMAMLSIRPQFLPRSQDLHLFKVDGSCELGVKLVWFIKLSVGFNKGEVSFQRMNMHRPLCREGELIIAGR